MWCGDLSCCKSANVSEKAHVSIPCLKYGGTRFIRNPDTYKRVRSCRIQNFCNWATRFGQHSNWLPLAQKWKANLSAGPKHSTLADGPQHCKADINILQTLSQYSPLFVTRCLRTIKTEKAVCSTPIFIISATCFGVYTTPTDDTAVTRHSKLYKFLSNFCVIQIFYLPALLFHLPLTTALPSNSTPWKNAASSKL
jgi:hypothetical protein